MNDSGLITDKYMLIGLQFVSYTSVVTMSCTELKKCLKFLSNVTSANLAFKKMKVFF